MTEKRFKLNDFDSDVEMWELLNTQAEIISDLEEENKQLRANYNSLSHNNGLLYDECSNKINALKKENEQLKSELAEIKRQEQEVIEYLRAYHNGDMNELKKELEK